MRNRWAREATIGLVASLTGWACLLAWNGFSQRSGDYLAPLALAALVLGQSGAFFRAWRGSPRIALVVQLGIVATWLHAALSGSLLPDPSSWDRVLASYERALDVAQTYKAPIPPSIEGFPPLMLVQGMLILLTFDLVVCSLRRPAAGGLLLLGVQTGSAAILEADLGWFSFALTAVCFVGLLALVHEAKLVDWSEGGEHPWTDTRSTSRLTSRSSALRIGLTATALAVVLPIAVPSIGDGVWQSLRTGPGGGDGSGLKNPMLDLQRNLHRGDDVPLVDVRTPANVRPTYLRIAVLDDFDGQAWRQGERNAALAEDLDATDFEIPGLDDELRESPEVTFSLTTSDDYSGAAFPLPYPPAGLPSPADRLRIDTDTWEVGEVGRDPDLSSRSVTGSFLLYTPVADRLEGAGSAPALIESRNLALPDTLPDWVQNRADELTAGATSDFQRALALQHWFRVSGGFRYSLKSSTGSGIEQLERFMGKGSDSRRGYCEQFATSMALLGRASGIPSRVVIGFLEPEYVDDSYWQFSAWDLHAWPEMYFEGSGWVRFEPTPPVRTGTAPAYTLQVPNLPGGSTGGGPDEEPSRTPEEPSASPTPEGDPFEVTSTDTRGLPLNPWVIAVVMLLLGLASPRIAGELVVASRRRRATSYPARIELAWREVNDAAADLGFPATSRPTVRTRAGALADHFDVDLDLEPAMASIERMVVAVEEARYAPVPRTRGGIDDERDVCIDSLRRSAAPGARRRASWWPRATLRRWGR
jgi:transglutaminase-like putative cysteine protease